MKKFSSSIFIISLFTLLAVSVSACTKIGSRTKDTNTNLVKILDVKWQPTVYAQDLNDDNKGDSLHLMIEVYSTYSINSSDGKLKSVKVSAVKIAETLGELKIIYPQHLDTTAFNYHYGPMEVEPKPEEVKNEGTSKEYKVVPLLGTFADEVGETSGIVKFKVVFQGVEEKTFDLNNADNRELLEQGGLKAEEMNNTVEFDLIMGFDDGVEAKKHFSLEIDGNGFFDPFYMNKNSSYQNVTF